VPAVRVEADGSVHVTTRLVLVIAVVVLFVLLLRRCVAVWQLRGGESACVCASERGYRRAENDSPKGIYKQHIFPKTQHNNSTTSKNKHKSLLLSLSRTAHKLTVLALTRRHGTSVPSELPSTTSSPGIDVLRPGVGRARPLRAQSVRTGTCPRGASTVRVSGRRHTSRKTLAVLGK